MPDAGPDPLSSERIPSPGEVDPVREWLAGDYPPPPGGDAAEGTGGTSAAAGGTVGGQPAAALTEVEQEFVHLYAAARGDDPDRIVAALARHGLTVTAEQVTEALAT